MQKARSQSCVPPKRHTNLLPLVGMWFQALFHSPHRGAFHLSLTVLVHYRLHGSISSPWRVVPPASRPVSRVGRYSGSPLRTASIPRTGLSPSLAPRSRGLPLSSQCASVGPTTPYPRGGAVWAPPRSLAATRS